MIGRTRMTRRTLRARFAATLAAAALVLAGCAPQPSFQVIDQPSTRLGTVESVQQVVSDPSGMGMIGGALIGGALGSLVGGGSGRIVASVVGAGVGGYTGNRIEQNNPNTTWQIAVRYDDGSFANIRQDAVPIVRPGDRVRVTPNGLELIGR